MKHVLLALFLGIVVAWPARAGGGETPETRLEFARKLRERGYAQLALEYLEKFRQEAPAGFSGQILIETAKTRLSLAKEREPEQRAALYAVARKELAEFVANNASSPDADQARLDSARLASLEAQSLLGMAYRQENPKAKHDLARRAEAQFVVAGKELEQAEKVLASAKDKQLARFERGKNLLDQATTYFKADLEDPAKNRKRAELVVNAQKLFEEVEKSAGKDDKSAALHLARAWLIRSYQEGGRPADAKLKLDRVLKETAVEARDGRRVARFFNLLYFVKDAKTIQLEGQAWLKIYPNERNSSEGFAIRFLLGQAYMEEAESLSKDPKNLKAKKLYDAAQREFGALANSDFREAQEANRLNLAISFRRLGEDTAIDKLKSFEDCFLKARLELVKMNEAGGQRAKAKDPAKEKAFEEQRGQHLQNAIQALQRGLQVADAGTSFQEIGEARFHLAYAHLLADDLVEAAKVAEDLARVKPPTKRSAPAAAYALHAYATLFARTGEETAKDRLRALARFILEDNKVVWAADSVMQTANYQLAMLAEKENNLPAAIGYLEKLSPDFPSYLHAQCQLANYALREAKEAKKAGDEKKVVAYQDKALAALKRVPVLPPATDQATAILFFSVQLGQGSVLFDRAFVDVKSGKTGEAIKKLAAMDQFLSDLKKQFDAVAMAIDPDPREKLGFSLSRLRKEGRRGLAEIEYRAGNYDKVLSPELTGETIQEIKQLAQDQDKVKLKDWQETGELLGLALRSQVQKGKLAQAKEVLALLGKLTDEEGLANSTYILTNLVQDLATQIKALKLKNDAAAIEKTRDNFAGFLQELKGQPGFLQSREQLQFLASCYASLDLHKEAADLFKTVTVPKIDPKKKMPTPAEQAEWQSYWQSQVLFGRSLRLAKDFKQADEVLRRTATDPTSRSQFLAQKELLFVLEDQNLYGSAATGWNKLMQSPALLRAFKDENLPEDDKNKLKATYFDCYYQMAFCVMKYAQNQKDAGKRAKALEDAAAYIARLEWNNPEGWTAIGPRFQELLKKETELSETYAKVKPKLKPASSK